MARRPPARACASSEGGSPRRGDHLAGDHVVLVGRVGDVTDADDVAWLRCLIWPGEPDRQERLDAALAIARRDSPYIVRGDLVDDLPALAP